MAERGAPGEQIHNIPRGRKSGHVQPHHDPCEQAHAFATVGVRDHVPVADGQEGDGDQPHGAQEVAGHLLLVMVPAGTQEGRSAGAGPGFRGLGGVGGGAGGKHGHAGERGCRVNQRPRRGEGVREVVKTEEGGEPRAQEAAFHSF